MQVCFVCWNLKLLQWFWHCLSADIAFMLAVRHFLPISHFMFPSLLPHTTRSTIETAPKLVDFCVCKSYFKNVAQRAYKQCLPTNNAKTIVVTLNFNIQSKHAHNFWWCLCSFTGFNNITFLNATSFLTFVKEVFRLVAQGSLWQNECFVTKWLHIYMFLWHLISKYTKLNKLCKIIFLISGKGKVVTKWMFWDQMTVYLVVWITFIF